MKTILALISLTLFVTFAPKPVVPQGFCPHCAEVK